MSEHYAGPTNPDGTLVHAADLVARGLISVRAILKLPAWDVDFASPGNERNIVRFNGIDVHSLYFENPSYLEGSNNMWHLNVLEIPIERVRFPSARGTLGNPPTPAINLVEVVIDTETPGDNWCTAVGWASLEFKIMSPVVLIHGTNSKGEFFQNQGFVDGLDAEFLLWDNSINMTTNSTAANGASLHLSIDEENPWDIPFVVRSFGVDSIHLVAHSKGGLDTREYLANHYPLPTDTSFKILSLTTLSTPHNGSILADVVEARKAAAERAAVVFFQGFPLFLNQLSWLNGTDLGTPSLTTLSCAAFNLQNVPALPGDITYGAVGADADKDESGDISFNPGVFPVVDEYREMRLESLGLALIHAAAPNVARGIIDRMYQTLRRVTAVSMTFSVKQIPGGPSFVVATVSAVKPGVDYYNDTFVTARSALGTGAFSAFTEFTALLRAASARNHASVANAGVAELIAPWLVAVEQQRGDLQ